MYTLYGNGGSSFSFVTNFQNIFIWVIDRNIHFDTPWLKSGFGKDDFLSILAPTITTPVFFETLLQKMLQFLYLFSQNHYFLMNFSHVFKDGKRN